MTMRGDLSTLVEMTRKKRLSRDDNVVRGLGMTGKKAKIKEKALFSLYFTYLFVPLTQFLCRR
jgi:hypothetical protein